MDRYQEADFNAERIAFAKAVELEEQIKACHEIVTKILTAYLERGKLEVDTILINAAMAEPMGYVARHYKLKMHCSFTLPVGVVIICDSEQVEKEISKFIALELEKSRHGFDNVIDYIKSKAKKDAS